jgi:hypothetical protein
MTGVRPDSPLQVSPAATPRRLLTALLRLSGGVIALAFLAVIMPGEWMVSTHAMLGMGELPRAPIVEYLTRSLAALYGFHGVLLLIIAGDPIRYRDLVWYVAAMNVSFGIMLLSIDLYAGMPALWTLFEGPPIAAMGVAIGWLNHLQPAAAVEAAEPGPRPTARAIHD